VTPAIPIARIAPKKPRPRRSDLNIVAITSPKMQRQPPEATAEMDAPGTSTIRQRLPATEHVPGEDRGTQLLPFWSLPIYLPMGFGLEWGGMRTQRERCW
jgi:hypothetical protein